MSTNTVSPANCCGLSADRARAKPGADRDAAAAISAPATARVGVFAYGLVWIAAIITVWTGWQYFHEARRQMG